MNQETADLAKGIDSNGKLYQRRAQAALTVLVRQAWAGEKIFYSDLARELAMPNPRNLNFVLGAIATSLKELGFAWNAEVPPLQAIVVNQHDGLPGSGFMHTLFSPEAYAAAPKRVKEQMVDAMLTEVYAYQDWRRVLDQFGAEHPSAAVSSQLLSRASRYGPTGGESEAHQKLKDYVERNPRPVGIRGRELLATQEFRLATGDSIDVLFVTRGQVFAVEVKSVISPEEDLVRGVFQCVKYEALLNAMEVASGEMRDVGVRLAIGACATARVRSLANILGVRLVEELGIG
jgi:hypothetical protein